MSASGCWEASVGCLQRASTLFDHLGDAHSAALVQVSLLTALAMLGRYAEAIACGESAVDREAEARDSRRLALRLKAA